MFFWGVVLASFVWALVLVWLWQGRDGPEVVEARARLSNMIERTDARVMRDELLAANEVLMDFTGRSVPGDRLVVEHHPDRRMVFRCCGESRIGGGAAGRVVVSEGTSAVRAVAGLKYALLHGLRVEQLEGE